jgi:hypothetical protein
METAQTRRAAQPMHHDVEDSDAFYETRIPSSARRYQQSAPPIPHDTTDDPALLMPITQRRRASTPTTRYPQEGRHRDPITKTEILPTQRRFPLVAVLVGMVSMVLLFMTIGALGTWWQTYQDDLHYGRPRTSQIDAIVGHSDSAAHPTHFIFLNLHGHVDIIEMPGGDASHMRVYTGPILYGDKADLVPVTGEVRDVNHDGKADLIIHIQNQQIIFLNTGQVFKEQ